MSNHLLTSHHDGVLSIVINRPEQLGAVSPDMMDAAASAIEDASASVRLAVITGTGRAFCSGTDLRAGAESSKDVLDSGARLVTAVTTAPFPVITAVNGVAAGIGASIALSADITLAVDSAYFLLPFAKVGLMPDGGATELVAASIGRARATSMALLGERLSAIAAVDIGLIYRSAPVEEFDAQLDALVDKLAHGPTRAYAETKKALNANTLPCLAKSFERESEGQLALIETADYAEGVRAFLEKRRAHYVGR